MKERKTQFSIDQISNNGNGLLAAYFPVNDPLIPLNRLKAYESAKVDVIEIGIKAQNPYADGAIIANSMNRATGTGSIVEATPAIDMIRKFTHDTLGMIFAYAENNVLASNPEEWSQVDGLLTLSTKLHQTSALNTVAQNHGTRITRFVTYSLPEEEVCAATEATGFVMLQYANGKTGIKSHMDISVAQRIKILRAANVTRPILTGIGISSKEQVRHAMDNGADGVVLGSISIVKGQESIAALEDYLSEIREVLNGG